MVDDPQANITQWGPLRPGGSNFTTHRLNEHPQGLEYRKNFKLMLFGALFALLGLGVSTRGVISGELFAGLFGLIFLTVGVWVLWPTSVLFHRELRSVTLKGRTVPFSTILALQLLTERVDGSDSADYDSHELNLVLQNGERLNVVDHAGKQTLREEANRLRGLIGCKVWDATSKLV
jgi:hypothetical protein